MLRNPKMSITAGFDLHVIYQASELEDATNLFEAFLCFIEENNIIHTRPKIFSTPVGPWPLPMWQVILPQHNEVYEDLGLCISWFMLNRGRFSVMIHPNSQIENSLGGVREDHTKNMLWLGDAIVLNTERL